MKSYLDAQARGSADLLIGRWMADYEDPDDFTFALFHSAGGHMRTFFSSPETDRLAEEARMESRPAVREGLYRKFESLLLENGVLIPLFHEVDYRIAAPGVRGLALRSSPPFVNYPEIGKSEAPAAQVAHEWGGGVLHVPVGGVVHDFDPASMAIHEQAETMPLVFETLTRDVEGGRVVPWLASEVIPEDGGARFRFRLRRGVRFHDGRALSARDVRYSFERVLQKGTTGGRFLLAPIRGAQSLIDGKASDLEGFHIVSPFGVRHRAGKAAVVLPRPRVVAGRRHRPGGDRRPRRELAEGLHRHGGVPRRELRARKTAGAGEEPRLLARRLSEERGRRLPVSASPPRRSAPSSSPAGSPSLRISFRPTPKPCARTRVSARRTARARAS